MKLLALLLLASPVWAGELSTASGSLRVQMGAAPKLEKDASKCFLKGEPVPCVGHAYDQRVGSVAMESQGSVIVDRDVLKSMIREAERQGGTLAVTVQPSPCYRKMQEAIREMKTAMHLNPNSRSLSRGFVMTEEAWEREFEPIYQECVK